MLYCLSATWTKTRKLIRCIIHKGGTPYGGKKALQRGGKIGNCPGNITGRKESFGGRRGAWSPPEPDNAVENTAELFKTERGDITAKKERREISELKSQIARKDSVIAELADENMSLKKKISGLKSTK